jgi:hypothetical protein
MPTCRYERRVTGSGRAALVAVAFGLCIAQARAAGPDPVFLDGFEPLCPGPGPSVTPGVGSALLLRGTVVTPATAFTGEVLVVGDTITCAAASCAGQAGASTAWIVETNGLIFPGLIDTQNFTLFDAFDQSDWAPPAVYGSHNDWPSDPRYGALVDAKQYLNGEGAPSVDLGCELDKYGELKGLIAGTTSIVGNAGGSERTCYGSIARTIDRTSNDLGADKIQTATLFPSTGSADQVCANFVGDSTDAYLVQIAEGTNTSARNEFTALGTVSTVDGCLYAPQTAIVHGTALADAELTTMAAAGMSLVWTPRSDVALYGATANVPLARAKGINVSLGTNGSITGSQNLLDELRYADEVDNATFGNVLAPQDLIQMATTGAAHALGLDVVLGSIAAGKKADLTVIAGACAAPSSALLGARPDDVRLVLVGGVPLYGDASLQAVAPAVPGCEALDVCGAPKFVCVAESGGTPTNKFDQTLAQIVASLAAGFDAYDALNLTQWQFAPIAPLVDCP